MKSIVHLQLNEVICLSNASLRENHACKVLLFINRRMLLLLHVVFSLVIKCYKHDFFWNNCVGENNIICWMYC